MGKVLIIGAGGVATVAAHKVAKNTDVFSEIMIASRTKSKCDAIVKAIGRPDIKTAQVDADSVEGTGLTVTHVNLLDNTVEGLECAADRIFSVQYHPESAPGPQDSAYLFDKFVSLMKEAKLHA